MPICKTRLVCPSCRTQLDFNGEIDVIEIARQHARQHNHSVKIIFQYEFAHMTPEKIDQLEARYNERVTEPVGWL